MPLWFLGRCFPSQRRTRSLSGALCPGTFPVGSPVCEDGLSHPRLSLPTVMGLLPCLLRLPLPRLLRDPPGEIPWEFSAPEGSLRLLLSVWVPPVLGRRFL